MNGDHDFYALRAMLDWQTELGATEAISDAPVNRYEAVPEVAKPATVPIPASTPEANLAAPVVAPDQVALATRLAAAASDLAALKAAIGGFDGCEMKRGARNTVFCDGQPGARVMIIGEAPGRDEDIAGRPFVGAAGQFLDRMLAAIGLARDANDVADAVYITNIMPWRPPQNRDPKPDEIDMLRPFVERHVALIKPDFLVLMGNTSCQTMLGRRGITRLRGAWVEALGLPCLPMFHPAYLLRNPPAKREAWHDLLMLRSRLNTASQTGNDHAK